MLEDTPLARNHLMRVIESRRNTLKIRPDSKLVFTGLDENSSDRISTVKKLLRQLSEKNSAVDVSYR